ncbi:hypothetical protein LZ554_004162 [Drepanopeziza brunnea f. sp. 'monogermtubi']|nr:hypothetical protein LZ554_004162 [Drepanopeziza brunnea f. sp. 'monogermtubi']
MIIIILHVLLIAAIVSATLSAHDVALTSQRLVKNTETNVGRGSAGVKYSTHKLTLDVVLQRLDREMGIRKGENATERVARRIRFLKERLERRRIAREREAGGGARVVQGLNGEFV